MIQRGRTNQEQQTSRTESTQQLVRDFNRDLQVKVEIAVSNFESARVHAAFQEFREQLATNETLSVSDIRASLWRITVPAVLENPVATFQHLLHILPEDRDFKAKVVDACFLFDPIKLARDFRSLNCADPEIRVMSAIACIKVRPAELARYWDHFELPADFDRDHLFKSGCISHPREMLKHFPDELTSRLLDPVTLGELFMAAVREFPASVWDLLVLKTELETGSSPIPDSQVYSSYRQLCQIYATDMEGVEHFHLIRKMVEASVTPTVMTLACASEISPEQLQVALPFVGGQAPSTAAALLNQVVDALESTEESQKQLRNLKQFLSFSPWLLDKTTFETYSKLATLSKSSAKTFLLSLKRATYETMLYGSGENSIRESAFFGSIVRAIYRPDILDWQKDQESAKKGAARRILSDIKTEGTHTYTILCAKKGATYLPSSQLLRQPAPSLGHLPSNDVKFISQAYELAMKFLPERISLSLFRAVGLDDPLKTLLAKQDITVGQYLALVSLLRIAPSFTTSRLSESSDVSQPSISAQSREMESIINQVSILNKARELLSHPIKQLGLTWRVIYSILHASEEAFFARDSVGLSSRFDVQSWEDPAYHQVIHFDLCSATVLGVTQMHCFSPDIGDRAGVLIRPNPADYLGRLFSPQDIASAMLELPQILAQEGTFDLFFPEQSKVHLLTNRDWLVDTLEELVDQRIEQEVPLTANLTSYMPGRVKRSPPLRPRGN